MSDIVSDVKSAKAASIELSVLPTEVKNNALRAMAEALDASREQILEANAADLEASKAMLDAGEISGSMYKRLKIDGSKIDGMIAGIEDVIGLPDPVGEQMSALDLDDGLTLYQIRCPIGMLGMIFESRPDVVPQIMSLCLKSGNSVAFKGGREAANSIRVLFTILRDAAATAGVPREAFVLMESRADIGTILGLDGYIDLLIPRGSNEFVRYMETLLVDSAIAGSFIPRMVSAYEANGVEVRGDERVCALSDAIPATSEDWDTEYGDLVISIKVVDSLPEAVDFINSHGSHHTDAIVAEDPCRAAAFVRSVDSADVFVNASTRFADGYRYGKGAEVGISTNKIHARGPVGMEGLMIYKYVLVGHGQVVKDYVGPGCRPFKHTPSSEDYPYRGE